MMRRIISAAMMMGAALAPVSYGVVHGAVFGGLLFVSVSKEASAHQQKAAVTQILYNKRSGNLEVSHRFVMHDAEHAVRDVFGWNADIYADKTTQEKFVNYTLERFELLGPEGQQLALKYLGYEIDGPHMWVYQEMPLQEGLNSLTIRHNVLRDLWPEQENLVNISKDGRITSTTLSGDMHHSTIEVR